MRKRASLKIVFHKQWSGKRPETINEGSRRDRPCEMGNNADEVCLADRGDLHHLRDPADVRERCANVVDIVVLDQLVKVPAVAPLLAGRDRDSYHSPQSWN